MSIDGAHAGHGDRGLGDVRAEHDAPPAVRLEDAVLLGGGQPGVHRQHLGAGLDDASECVRRVVDLSFAAQEHEHIARALTPELLDGVADRLDLIAVVVARRPEGPVAQLDRVHTPGHLDDRRIVTVLRRNGGRSALCRWSPT